jgi:type IV pilus assembly protein PilC
MGYFVTKIAVKKQKKVATDKAKTSRKRSFAIGGVNSKVLTMFTRQLSILQDAGLPILRSLRILEAQCKPGRFKNCLMDTCDEIEGGSTLSEAMGKSPKAFDRLYVNMIKAGERAVRWKSFSSAWPSSRNAPCRSSARSRAR